MYPVYLPTKIQNMKRIFLLSLSLFLTFYLSAQEKEGEKELPYIYPEDEQVRQSLKEWQDLKFGLFIHWGAYSQWGIVESWSISPEDYDFCNVRPKGSDYSEYIKKYEQLKNTFNPVKFNPDKWADAAKDAGMKYVVFTTKHHDGFNMYDTKYSDYKITDKECPFHSNSRANIAKAVFDSFRAKGLIAGAYYSIADWNNDDYWWNYFPPRTREINYSPKRYPKKWASLNTFINNQLKELTSGEYGKLNLLWFDLCEASSEKKLDWERFSQTVRSQQPGIITVARHQHDKFENYRTPEQKIPDQALDYPWESCMTMATQWSYKPSDTYKPASQIIQFLIQIVSRGGNFLLNVGPGPDGELDPVAYDRLNEIGQWMKINGEGIYGTKPVKPYKETKIAFTGKENTVYAFYLPDSNETKIPRQIFISGMKPASGEKVYLLGHKQALHCTENGMGIVVDIPSSLQNNPPCKYAWTLKFNVK